MSTNFFRRAHFLLSDEVLVEDPNNEKYFFKSHFIFATRQILNCCAPHIFGYGNDDEDQPRFSAYTNNNSNSNPSFFLTKEARTRTSMLCPDYETFLGSPKTFHIFRNFTSSTTLKYARTLYMAPDVATDIAEVPYARRLHVVEKVFISPKDVPAFFSRLRSSLKTIWLDGFVLLGIREFFFLAHLLCGYEVSTTHVDKINSGLTDECFKEPNTIISPLAHVTELVSNDHTFSRIDPAQQQDIQDIISSMKTSSSSPTPNNNKALIEGIETLFTNLCSGRVVSLDYILFQPQPTAPKLFSKLKSIELYPTTGINTVLIGLIRDRCGETLQNISLQGEWEEDSEIDIGQLFSSFKKLRTMKLEISNEYPVYDMTMFIERFLYTDEDLKFEGKDYYPPQDEDCRKNVPPCSPLSRTLETLDLDLSSCPTINFAATIPKLKFLKTLIVRSGFPKMEKDGFLRAFKDLLASPTSNIETLSIAVGFLPSINEETFTTLFQSIKLSTKLKTLEIKLCDNLGVITCENFVNFLPPSLRFLCLIASNSARSLPEANKSNDHDDTMFDNARRAVAERNSGLSPVLGSSSYIQLCLLKTKISYW